MSFLRGGGYAAILLAVCCSAHSARADVSVRFDPPADTVDLGATFTVDIVADFSDPVIGWGLDLTISNDSVLSLVGSPTIGPDWIALSSLDGDDLVGMTLPGSSVSGTDVLLATVTFHADAVGTVDLVLSDDYPDDLTEGFPLDPIGFDTDVTYADGSVTVVPEPVALTLLLIGAPAVLRRRRR